MKSRYPRARKVAQAWAPMFKAGKKFKDAVNA